MMQSGQRAPSGGRDRSTLLARANSRAPILYSPELRRLPLGVAGDDQGGGGSQRPRPLHRLHRLRMDVQHRRQQPPSQRHLPRQRDSSPARSCRITTLPPGSDNPRDLWKWMAAYEEKTGGNVLAIAHNGNLSNGRMFPMIEPGTDQPIDREYAETARQMGAPLRGDPDQGRRRDPSVPVAERRVRQFRALGQGQPRPQRGEDAGDARVRIRPLGAQERPQARAAARGQSLQVRHDRLDRRPYRPRRRRGGQLLRQDVERGAEPGARRAPIPSSRPSWPDDHGLGDRPPPAMPRYGRRRTRAQSLFDAMERRETYATTGPRMIVRFFGGYDFTAADANTRSPAFAGYTKGVPMGGDLGPAPDGKAPDLPGRRAQGPDRRQSRPLPDRQGLARRRGRGP